MTERVVITGLGVISSIGIGWREFWDAIIRGTSGITPVTAFDTTAFPTHMGGQVRIFDPELFLDDARTKTMNRATQMALAAAKLSLQDSGLTPENLAGLRVGVSHGTTLGAAQTIEEVDTLLVSGQRVPEPLISQMFTHAPPSEIAREFGLKGPTFMFSTACSAGNYAVAYGYDLIRLRRADIVIAGASDPFSRIEYTGFNQFAAVAPERCRPFDKNRKGMIPGEGAGILVLESLDSALRRHAPVYAELLGYGLSCDAFHMTTASVAGIAECMRNAMREAGIAADAVDYISAHGTGTPANDRAESAAIREVFGARTKEIPVSSIKSMIGHTMGAASAIEAIASALAVRNDIVPPTMNFETPDPECDIDCVPNKARNHKVDVALNNSYAFGGNNASLVLKKYPT